MSTIDVKEVTVQPVPGTPETVSLEAGNGDTVRDALEAADVKAGEGSTVQINGESYDLDDTVRDGDTIVVSQEVSGA